MNWSLIFKYLLVATLSLSAGFAIRDNPKSHKFISTSLDNVDDFISQLHLMERAKRIKEKAEKDVNGRIKKLLKSPKRTKTKPKNKYQMLTDFKYAHGTDLFDTQYNARCARVKNNYTGEKSLFCQGTCEKQNEVARKYFGYKRLIRCR